MNALAAFARYGVPATPVQVGAYAPSSAFAAYQPGGSLAPRPRPVALTPVTVPTQQAAEQMAGPDWGYDGAGVGGMADYGSNPANIGPEMAGMVTGALGMVAEGLPTALGMLGGPIAAGIGSAMGTGFSAGLANASLEAAGLPGSIDTMSAMGRSGLGSMLGGFMGVPGADFLGDALGLGSVEQQFEGIVGAQQFPGTDLTAAEMAAQFPGAFGTMGAMGVAGVPVGALSASHVGAFAPGYAVQGPDFSGNGVASEFAGPNAGMAGIGPEMGFSTDAFGLGDGGYGGGYASGGVGFGGDYGGGYDGGGYGY